VQSGSPTPKPTPSPTPSPTLHPGDRDGKFTDGEIKIQENSYRSQNLSIEITKYFENDITYFIAEVYVRDMDNFYAAFADGKYGSYRARTTEIAQENDAIFAVSGDYYNAREGGLIIRNSEVYRNEKEPYREVLALYEDGSMKGYRYKEAYDGTLAYDEDIVHTYVFGPILVTEGELGREFSDRELIIRHPRLGIGMIDPYHYIFLLADGRKEGYSIGMTIAEMADVFLKYNCVEAYNLDGGGTATMVFLNELVNMPQGTTTERGIGDAICFIE
jgi:exopolysaccharide biosynthesis protein